jgi:uncharacterized protein
MSPASSVEIGVISDTHGLLRPEAVAALAGCALILHAGDVGGPDVLEALGRVAPVRAVRGNVDVARTLRDLPPADVVESEGVTIYMLHDLAQLDLDPAAAGFHVVISGHSHQPAIERRQGVLYLNPGSAGPRRFRLPVTVARLRIEGTRVEARLIEIVTFSLA